MRRSPLSTSPALPPDRIIVGGIKFHAYHGLTRLEREVGVRCSIDVEMTLDLSGAISSDRLGQTIDYREVHRLVLDIGQRRESLHLIESLAGRIAQEMLGRFPIAEVTVRVRKETPIIDGVVDYIGVQVTRSKARARRKTRATHETRTRARGTAQARVAASARRASSPGRLRRATRSK